MAVATSPDEVADVEVTLLRNHVREQRVAGDVERDTKEEVGTSLIQLTRQLSFRNVELEKCMTWHQRHLVEISDIPCANNDASRVGVTFD